MAQEIFDKIRDEELLRLSVKSNLDTIKIENTTFHIRLADLPQHPLFFYEFSKDDGKEMITINQKHPLYSSSGDELIAQLASALYAVKHSMTGPNGSLFLDRFHQKLQLIER